MAIGKLPVAEDATPVFIAGAPRSGTTLLTAVINSHPQIMITNELRPFMFLNDIRRRMRSPSELVPMHPLRDRWRNTLISHAANMVISFYRNKVTKDELGCPAECGDSVEPVIKAFGDKNPGYADPHSPDCLEFIKGQIPNAKFIHIHRDPRACIASYLSINVYPDDINRCIDIWSRHTKSMIELRDKHGSDVVFTLGYEEFVTDDGANIFKALEAFLGVDEAREPIEFLRRERQNPVPYRSPATPRDKLGGAVWQDRLTSVQIDDIISCTSELMIKLGRND